MLRDILSFHFSFAEEMMKNITHLILLVIVVLLFAGCAGKSRTFFMGDQEIVFPNGTIFGGASKDQAAALAEILVQSHNKQMSELGLIAEKNKETAQQVVKILEALSQSQGTGEITIFFNLGSNVIPNPSLEYDRLVRFVDYVAREIRGRQIHFVLIGSASTIGSSRRNAALSLRRAEAPIDIIDKYLVNIKHDYFIVNAVGDLYSPTHVDREIHNRYQHVRIIAFYETDQLPEIPNPVYDQ